MDTAIVPRHYGSKRKLPSLDSSPKENQKKKKRTFLTEAKAKDAKAKAKDAKAKAKDAKAKLDTKAKASSASGAKAGDSESSDSESSDSESSDSESSDSDSGESESKAKAKAEAAKAEAKAKAKAEAVKAAETEARERKRAADVDPIARSLLNSFAASSPRPNSSSLRAGLNQHKLTLFEYEKAMFAFNLKPHVGISNVCSSLRLLDKDGAWLRTDTESELKSGQFISYEGKVYPLTKVVQQEAAFASPMQHSKGPASKFLATLERNIDSGFVLTLGDQQFEKQTVKDLKALLRGISATKASKIWTDVGLEYEERGLSMEEKDLASVFGRSSKLSEPDMQAALAECIVKYNLGIDTQQPGKFDGQLPYYLPKERGTAATQIESGIFRATAHPDICSRQIPLCIEVKGKKKKRRRARKKGDENEEDEEDEEGAGEEGEEGEEGKFNQQLVGQEIEVIHQGCDRVATQLSLFGYLKLSLCLCIAASRCWLCAASRQNGEVRGAIKVLLLPSFSLGARLYCELQNTVLLQYLTADGPAIIRALKFVGIDPVCCRTRSLRSDMQNFVYTVQPGELVDTGEGNQLVPGIVDSRGEYAIKVVSSAQEFQSELKALKDLTSRFSKYYALAYISSKEKGWFRTPGIPASKRLDAPDDECWWKFKKDIKISRSCIFMLLGSSHLSVNQHSRQILGEATAAVASILTSAHELGWCHGDLRPCNVVKFSAGWQLIDWGLAVPPGEFCVVDVEGSRGQCAGPRVREALKRGAHAVAWNTSDDWEMMALMLLPSWKAAFESA